MFLAGNLSRKICVITSAMLLTIINDKTFISINPRKKKEKKNFLKYFKEYFNKGWFFKVNIYQKNFNLLINQKWFFLNKK